MSCAIARNSILFFLLLASHFYLTAQHLTIAAPAAWVTRVDIDTEKSSNDTVSGGYYYLLVDRQTSIVHKERFAHTVYKILSAEGLQESSDIKINFDPAYQRVILHSVFIHRDGKIIDRTKSVSFKIIQQEEDAERYLYDESLTCIANLKDIRTDDIVEYSFTRKGFNPIFGDRFADEQFFDFGVPNNEFDYRIEAPASLSLKIEVKNGLPHPTVTTKGATTDYTWSVKKPLTETYEKNTPSWFTLDQYVSVSTAPDWSDIVKWSLPRYSLSTSEKAKIKQRAASQFKASGNNEYALQAIRFVQDEVRYLGFESGVNSHKPHSPLQVMEQRFGDCKDKSLLLTALLNAKGIEAWPMLVNTEWKTKMAERQPSVYAFDHCVVHVALGGKEFNIDPTISNQGGSLESINFPGYGKGLIVREGTAGFVDLPVNVPAPLRNA